MCLTLASLWTIVVRLHCPWDFPGKNTGVGCHYFFQGVFLTQDLNPHLLHWHVDSLPLSFPTFFQFKPEFCTKELMISAIVNSRFCFCWLYRASSSLAAKNIMNLILVLTIWWCPCVESSLGLLGQAMTSMFSRQHCYPLPCFILYWKAKMPVISA